MKLIETPKHGDAIDATDTPYPTVLNVAEQKMSVGSKRDTTFGYVLRGEAKVLLADGRQIPVRESGFFAVPDWLMVDPGDDALVVLITRFGYRGMEVFGRIEEKGRLSYIDGCSDSMLVYPPRQGDPVFNHLHFPPGIVQTQHTHPTIRFGVVARGGGDAFGPVQLGKPEKWTRALTPGAVFLLEPQEMHSFRTDRTGTTMDVIAYHPDSDWGPTDTAHPMRNRTYIGANPFNTGG